MRGGEQDAIRCAKAIVSAGAANADDWQAAREEPMEFLTLTLQRWIAEGYGDLPRLRSLDAVLVHGLSDVYYAADEQGSPNAFHIAIEPDAYQAVYLRDTIAHLENIDRRLPATFHDLLVATMYAVGFAFSWRSVIEEGMEEYFAHLLMHEDLGERAEELEGELDDATIEECVRMLVPECLHLKPYSERALRRRVRSLRDVDARRWFETLLSIIERARLLRASFSKDTSAWGAFEDADVMHDWPIWYLGIEHLDDLDGAFDQWCADRSNWGIEAVPSTIIQFDITRPETILRARDRVRHTCWMIGATKRLVDGLPNAAHPEAVKIAVTV